jgi:4-amino-4-deoxy-L-arabinose transferase-like glycosyltransferase
VLLGAGLVLRVATIIGLPPHTWFAGGDGPYYVRQAWLIAHGALTEPLRTVGPLYPFMLSLVWQLFPGHAEPATPDAVAASYLLTVRLAQATIGTLMVAIVFALGRQLGLARRAAMVGAIGVALGPAFVIEPFYLRTESLCLLLLTGALLAYVSGQRAQPMLWSTAAGILCALAAVTRPVLLLLPVALSVHLLIVRGRAPGALLVGALLVLAPWQIRLHEATGRWLPEGFSANLLLGAHGEGRPPDPITFHALERRAASMGRGILGEALHAIATSPTAWVARRGRNVAASLAQPHGTSDLGGPSVKAAFAGWLQGERTTSELRPIVESRGFLMRVLIYAFHYTGLALAAVGFWVRRRDWRTWLPLYIVIAYVVSVHAVLTASPRYLFPIQPFVWILAGSALASRQTHPLPAVQESAGRSGPHGH